MAKRTHSEVIEEMHKSLSQLSTHSEDVKYLGCPEHIGYQDCWERFYKRYHKPTLDYILKRANWPKSRLCDAEDLASLVYEKGFRWNFKRQNGVRFRKILGRLVKDVLIEYFQNLGEEDHPILMDMNKEDVSVENDLSALEKGILQIIVTETIKSYPLKERKVIRFMLKNNGYWPESRELAKILGYSVGNPTDLEEERARKWKQRHKELYQFSIETKYQASLDKGQLDEELREEFKSHKVFLLDNVCIKIQEKNSKWLLKGEKEEEICLILRKGDKLNIYKDLWEDFLQKMREQLATLGWGEKAQQKEIEYFTKCDF